MQNNRQMKSLTLFALFGLSPPPPQEPLYVNQVVGPNQVAEVVVDLQEKLERTRLKAQEVCVSVCVSVHMSALGCLVAVLVKIITIIKSCHIAVGQRLTDTHLHNPTQSNTQSDNLSQPIFSIVHNWNTGWRAGVSCPYLYAFHSSCSVHIHRLLQVT